MLRITWQYRQTRRMQHAGRHVWRVHTFASLNLSSTIALYNVCRPSRAMCICIQNCRKGEGPLYKYAYILVQSLVQVCLHTCTKVTLPCVQVCMHPGVTANQLRSAALKTIFTFVCSTWGGSAPPDPPLSQPGGLHIWCGNWEVPLSRTKVYICCVKSAVPGYADKANLIPRKVTRLQPVILALLWKYIIFQGSQNY